MIGFSSETSFIIASLVFATAKQFGMLGIAGLAFITYWFFYAIGGGTILLAKAVWRRVRR